MANGSNLPIATITCVVIDTVTDAFDAHQRLHAHRLFDGITLRLLLIYQSEQPTTTNQRHC